MKCPFCGAWFDDTMNGTPGLMKDNPDENKRQSPSGGSRNNGNGGSASSFFKTYFVDSYFKHYADFGGHTGCAVFWKSFLASCIIGIGFLGLAASLYAFSQTGLTIGGIIVGLYALVMLVPQLSICCRRLRDAGKSPYLILIGLVPVIGTIPLVILLCGKTGYVDPTTGQRVIASNDPVSKFKAFDWVIVALCVVSLTAGLIIPDWSEGIKISQREDSWESQQESREESSRRRERRRHRERDRERDHDRDREKESPSNSYGQQQSDEKEVRPYDNESRYDETGNTRRPKGQGPAYPDSRQAYHLTGKIDNKYPVDMNLSLRARRGTYYYKKYGPDHYLNLSVTRLEDDGGIEIYETTVEGEHTGFFEGNIIGNQITGTYTNCKGVKMPFRLVFDE